MNYQVKGISGYVWGVRGCVPRCVRVCAGLHGYGRVWVGLHGYALVCACVLDEFSEFLLENRVPTSEDFNTYPIRIFLLLMVLIICF